MSDFSKKLIKFLWRLAPVPVLGQMFVVPLIGLLKGKDYRLAKQRKQRSVGYRIRQVTKYVTLLCIAGAALVFVYPSLFFGEDEAAAERLLIKEGKFGEIIAEISDEQLVEYFRNFGSEPNDSLLNKVAKLRKRTRIANKLRESSDPVFQQQGVAFSLASNSELALVYLGEGDPLSEVIRKALVNQSKIGEGATQSPELDALTSVAKSVVLLADALHLEKSTDEDSEISSQSAFDSLTAEFDLGAKLAVNEPTSARLLYQTAYLAEKNAENTDVAVPMYQSIVNHLQDSEHESLRKLSAACRNQILNLDTAMTSIVLGDSKDLQSDQIRAAKEKIVSISQSRDLNDKEWDHIADLIHKILRMGHVSEAKELLNHCTDQLIKLESKAKNKKLFGLQQWVAEIGERFAIDGLSDTYGDEVHFRPKKYLCRVVIYANPDNKAQTKKAMEFIVNRAGRAIENQSTAVIMIYAKDGIGKTEEDNDLKADLEFAKKSDYLSMWVVDTNSKSGAEHALKYPVVEYPFVVVLDEEKRVTVVNPNLFEFERHLVSVLKKSSNKKRQQDNHLGIDRSK